jgi:RNA polymerase sigma-70 factor, ECF subfamily
LDCIILKNREYHSKHELLIRKIQSGDKKAFEKLYRTHYSDLCDFIRRYVGSPAICEELVQDLFLSVWNMRETWNPNGSPRAYLFKGAKNRALDYLKHLEVERRYLNDQKIEIDNNLLSSKSNPEPGLFREVEQPDQELADKIDEAIHRLPEQGKIIFNLSRDDGLTYREIADVLDISVKTVETQMGRSLNKLRCYLSDYLPGLAIIYVCIHSFM